jgi:hypothetical protein
VAHFLWPRPGVPPSASPLVQTLDLIQSTSPMPKKKYQIFVSSTFEDLREERSRVFETILAMGHIPVGMEVFASAGRSSVETIQSFLDQCDYQVTIIGSRYGSIIEGRNVSFTEMEYEYAMAEGIPQLSFLQTFKGGPFYGNEGSKHRKALEKFRIRVSTEKSKLIQSWQIVSELQYHLATALPKLMETFPRRGWIAGDEQSPDMERKLLDMASEAKGTRIALDRYRRNVVESNRQLIEKDLIEFPDLTGTWKCIEKPIVMELRQYAGALVGSLKSGAFEHWIHGVCTSHDGEISLQIWRWETDSHSRTDLRTTVMHGTIRSITPDSFVWETFASRGDADLPPDFSEMQNWKRAQSKK